MLSRYAFQVKPQFEEADDHTWKAWCPDADWSVTADSQQAALDKLREEYTRRMNAGEDPQPRSSDIYQQHLKSPVAGVYAMDAELFRHLRALGEVPLGRASWTVHSKNPSAAARSASLTPKPTTTPRNETLR
ncbi:hypothetical protein [uncultured Mycobacterium sp.]|uniref:hypothetical protein n=1 Tax=uncultured Mycobacterium sp. TaxID=171292 RepID=UPI0035CA509D